MDFEMFSVAGNGRVHTMVKYAEILTEENSRKRILQYIIRQMKSIAEKHPEIKDTAVRENIAAYLDKSFKEAGLIPLDIFEIQVNKE